MKTEEIALKKQIEKDWLPFGQKLLKSNYKQVVLNDVSNSINGITGHCDLEEYQRDIIPDWVLDKVKEARLFGFKSFDIWYMERPYTNGSQGKDPIILGIVKTKNQSCSSTHKYNHLYYEIVRYGM